ncbi:MULTISPECIES: ribonucleotide-diphosphate reductase subunit beta [Exiguobacterium]|uniref:ribonucleotide-diphosphate reductase subunit beta n=1 Tax=Exiguobacterium TaxID=33986 RepID=UPI00103F9D2F|nr:MULTISPECIES: ribonucleotide-diphosphate reductase subunit beta [Exiguobacterium]MCT4777609.1 ribonucleotide-diphosphate reductase subunit beta [Exiguobacterium aquaticum]MCT4789761.1 ribonucleotide-diphosphate reductase subunit beta [Exiguobacterium mexicanum]TCI72801.1 ribonucleotide-diphosphate reductase subunit beta [Exiguobacterium sp. IPCI3]TCI82199.1 ribonucleotide-diphosphate reductase subunit beta [Exiguobacterium sp. IPCH1]TCI83705.1 ribonucleotide-diphosphate reductase subunit be
MTIQKIKLLSPKHPNRATAIIGGETSSIVNWNDIAYPQFYTIYKQLLSNFWIPDEISMSKDMQQWPQLTEREQDAFKRIIGLLSILDSVQTRYILESSMFSSDSSVHAVLAVIAQQEVVHNQSYSYVLSSLVPLSEQNRIFDIAKDDEMVMKRNQFILDLYEDFRADQTAETFAKSLVASIILEGINFYSGFAYFYNLARHQKMVGTSTMISYIQRDEMQHSYFVSQLLRAVLTENPEIDADGSFSQFVYDTMAEAVDLEIEWCEYVLRDLDGLDVSEMRDYVKYLANKRLRVIGLNDLYEGFNEDVMPWIRAYSDDSLNATKSDFFEQKSRSYAKVTDANGFDDL